VNATPLVIGYGNTLRGDDAVGICVAERLAGCGRGLDVRMVAQLTPELSEAVAASERAIFIDARRDRLDQDVLCEPIEENDEAPVPWLGHHGEPRALLALSRALYGRSPRAWMVTIPAASFEPGKGLSPLAERGVGLATDAVLALLDAPLP